MKKPKIKKRGGRWIVRANREKVICYSLSAARLWLDVLGRSEKQCI